MASSSRKGLALIRHFRLRPRLAVSILAGCLIWAILPQAWREATRLLVAWDISTALYLTLAGLMMARSTPEKIRTRAALEDEGRLLILALTTVTAIASLAAIVAELATAKAATGHVQWQHIALAGLTVCLSWTFMQTIFALHYAHEYYTEYSETAGGLEFPAKYMTPDYWDFAYFSFVIGTAAQTADINITSRITRRTVTLHCMLVFFFNTTILALTVNIGASLF